MQSHALNFPPTGSACKLFLLCLTRAVRVALEAAVCSMKDPFEAAAQTLNSHLGIEAQAASNKAGKAADKATDTAEQPPASYGRHQHSG